MTLRQFQVRRDDLATHRIVEGEQAALADGEVRAKVDRFALTANNITYGVVGERIGYWKFCEPLDNDDGGWGIIPVWGFAEIVESHADGVAVGDRIYGYFPMASELVMQPVHINDQRMIDGAAHRAELPRSTTPMHGFQPTPTATSTTSACCCIRFTPPLSVCTIS